MSETLVTTNPSLLIDPLPIIPQSRPIDPIVQCGVLYLGSAPTSAGFRGLDSIQEPFSHRYPVDGTNTLRGIDAVLSVYDNGIQLVFTRQPYTVVFFPISSLVYCASVRFTVIENDQAKPQSAVDWRFMPLDAIINNENKHPPLFCAVTKRTQILPGNECHCFITKSFDAALALIQTITKVYSNLRPGVKCLKSPIFYQLDHFGRKLSEINGVIYISPANDDDTQLNQTKSNRLTDESIRNYLFDPSYDGFFYRTDASLIEQWQLWDDDDIIGSRPRPPASPFGLHEGLYHDDTTHEVQRYLRQMENEDQSCSCTTSHSSSKSLSSTTTSTTTSTTASTSTCSSSSISTKYSRQQTRRYSNDQKSIDDSDQFNISLSNLQGSSFEPVLTQKTAKTKKSRRKPIIIEKILPKPIVSIPILNPKLPELPVEISKSVEERNINYVPSTNSPTFSYRINERGEKITREGNRIVFMDVVQMNTNKNQINSPAYIPTIPQPHPHKQRASKHIPILDLRSLERLFQEKKSKNKRHSSIDIDNKVKEQSINTNHSITPDKLDNVIQTVQDYPESPPKLTDQAIQTETSSIKKQHRKSSIVSSTNSLKSETHHHRHNQSTVVTGPTINYVERPMVPSVTPSQTSSHTNQSISITPVFTNEKLNEYLSNIYGTAQSIKSTSTSTSYQETKPIDHTTVQNDNYRSAFRYMQSSMNRNILQEYHNAY